MEGCKGLDDHLEINGLRLHYVQWGDASGRPILLLHGVASFARIWDFIAPAFKDQCRLIALDWRGHGESDWSPAGQYRLDDYVTDLADFLEELDLHDITIAGHSLGAWVALNYLVRKPGRIRNLVAGDFRTGFTPEELEQSLQQSLRPQREFATADESIERFVSSLSPTVASRETLQHLAKHAIRQTTTGGWALRFDRAVLAAQEMNPWEVYRQVRVPTLVLRGAKSPMMSHDAAMMVGEAIPGANVVEIDEAYHHLFLDQPARFISLVQAFMST